MASGLSESKSSYYSSFPQVYQKSLCQEILAFQHYKQRFCFFSLKNSDRKIWLHLSLPFPHCKPTCSPSNYGLSLFFLTNCYCVYMCLFIYLHIPKYNLFNLYKATCMYDFSTDHLELDKQCALPWRELPLSFPAFLCPVGHVPWCHPCSAHT